MISLIPLSIFILGLVMFFDRDASFAQCFRGLFLILVAVVLFVGIGLSQIIPHEKTNCPPITPAIHRVM
jgi:hypothetical protein